MIVPHHLRLGKEKRERGKRGNPQLFLIARISNAQKKRIRKRKRKKRGGRDARSLDLSVGGRKERRGKEETKRNFIIGGLPVAIILKKKREGRRRR